MTADDPILLERFAANRDEAAFAELVRRYLNLVYFAALRQVGGDTHRAEDVAQTVFTLLARKAASLTRHQTLAGWLHTTTRFAASEALRTERRRVAREQEAHTMQELTTEPMAQAEWERLRPVIDEALNELGDADREAVLLRFFADQPLAAIGEKLQVSENAARMRVDRALEKLRALLVRRQITSTTAALAVALANQPAIALPAHLAASVTSSAIAHSVGGPFVRTTTILLAKLGLALLLLAVAGGVWMKWASEASHSSRTAATSFHKSSTADANVQPAAKTFGRKSSSAATGADADTDNAANEFLQRGYKYRDAKQYDQAIAAFTAAIGLNPRLVEAYIVRADVNGFDLSDQQQNGPKAVADYEKALALDPRSHHALFNSAVLYAQLRQFDRAIANYTTIVEGSADFSDFTGGGDKAVPNALYYRGRAYQDGKNDNAAAIADYDEALRRDPEVDSPGSVLLWRRGVAHQALGQYEAAEADFSAAYDRDPQYPNALASWAWQLATAPDAKNRDAAAALEFAVKANEIFSYKNAEHLDVLAAAYAENGRFDDAVTTEQKAIASIAKYQEDLRPAMQGRLALYQVRQPFRGR